VDQLLDLGVVFLVKLLLAGLEALGLLGEKRGAGLELCVVVLEAGELCL